MGYVVGILTCALFPRVDFGGFLPMAAARVALATTTLAVIGFTAKKSERLRLPFLLGFCLGIAWMPLFILLVYLFAMISE